MISKVHRVWVSLWYGLFFVIAFNAYGQRFETLDDFVGYADTLEEHTPWTGDWLDPDFESIFLKQLPGKISRIASSLGVKFSAWNLHDLEPVLHRVISAHEKTPSIEVLEREVKEGECYVFWGDLHGAFHSFLRDLKQLQKEGIIDKGLRISEKCSLVLLGDAINRSPYTLQLLHLVLLLLERNPGRFIYLAGNMEQSHHWKDFLTMRQPLRILGGLLDQIDRTEKLPLEEELDTFFDKLPQALILKYKDGSLGQIYCSQAEVKPGYLPNKSTKALIRGENRHAFFSKLTGLEFVDFSYGATSWSLISSPITVYQDFLKFYNDAFVRVDIGKRFRDWLMVLHTRDVRKKEDFSKEYGDLITGLQRKTEKEIREIQKKPIYSFGSMVALLGGNGPGGVAISRGIDGAVMYLNERGGVNGHLLYPIILDDERLPRQGKINARLLTDEYHVDVFVCPQGTPPLMAYIDRVKKGEILVMFPRTGAMDLANPELKYMLNARAMYDEEIFALIDLMINEFKVKSFAFIYPEDTFGIPFMKLLHKELEKYGTTKTTDISYQPADVDFSGPAKKLREATDDAVGMFLSATAPTREFLTSLGMEFFIGRTCFGPSFLETEPFRQFVDERGLRFTLSYPIPDPRAKRFPLFDIYDEAEKRFGAPYDTSSFEGFLATMLLAESLKHIDPPFTKEKIINFFEGLKNFAYHGLTLNFIPERRGLDMPVWVMTSEGKWFEYHNKQRVVRKSIEEGDIQNLQFKGNV